MATLFLKIERGREVRMLQVVVPGLGRKTIRLGDLRERAAERFRQKVEHLVACMHVNEPIDVETAKWVGGLSDPVHRALATAGLVNPRQKPVASTTLAAFAEKHIAQKQGQVKPRSIDLLEQTRARLISFFGAQTPLERITADMTADWRASLLAGGLAEATVRLHTRNAKSIFNDAVDRELLARSPFRRLPSGAVAADRDRYVSVEEITRVLGELDHPQWRLFVGMGRFAGLRLPSETEGLMWRAVHLDTGKMDIFAPKTGSTRVVPIVPRLRELLEAAYRCRDESTDAVFTIPMSNRHRRVLEAIERAGLERWPDLFQALRRSAETDFADLLPQHAVSMCMGHGIAVSARHYLQMPQELFDRVSGARPRSALQNALQHRNARPRTEVHPPKPTQSRAESPLA